MISPELLARMSQGGPLPDVPPAMQSPVGPVLPPMAMPNQPVNPPQNQQGGFWQNIGSMLSNPQFQQALTQMLVTRGPYGGYAGLAMAQQRQQMLENQQRQQQINQAGQYQQGQVEMERQRIQMEEERNQRIADQQQMDREAALEQKRQAEEEKRARDYQARKTAALAQIQKAIDNGNKGPLLEGYIRKVARDQQLTREDMQSLLELAASGSELVQASQQGPAQHVVVEDPRKPGKPMYASYNPKAPAGQRYIDENTGKPIVNARPYYQPQASQALEDQATPVMDPTSQALLAQTGLSQVAFQIVTGQPTGRMSQAQRMAANKEIRDWSVKNGVDTSLIKSTYDAYSKVLNTNIKRKADTQVMEDEVLGTIENLREVVKSEGLGNVNMANVLKILSGKQVNDPLAQRYAYHLEQLRVELAGYQQAVTGNLGKEIDQSDMRRADEMIRNGIAQGGLDGLEKGVRDSTGKMGPILEKNIRRAQKGIWDAFGVGQNLKMPEEKPNTLSPEAQKVLDKWKGKK